MHGAPCMHAAPADRRTAGCLMPAWNPHLAVQSPISEHAHDLSVFLAILLVHELSLLLLILVLSALPILSSLSLVLRHCASGSGRERGVVARGGDMPQIVYRMSG